MPGSATERSYNYFTGDSPAIGQCVGRRILGTTQLLRLPTIREHINGKLNTEPILNTGGKQYQMQNAVRVGGIFDEVSLGGLHKQQCFTTHTNETRVCVSALWSGQFIKRTARATSELQ